MRNAELVKQGKELKIKIKILSNLLNVNISLMLEEVENTAGTERVKENNVVYCKDLISTSINTP